MRSPGDAVGRQPLAEADEMTGRGFGREACNARHLLAKTGGHCGGRDIKRTGIAVWRRYLFDCGVITGDERDAQRVDPREQGRGDVVRVDLVSREKQHVRPAFVGAMQIVDELVGILERRIAGPVRLAARGMADDELVDRRRHADEGGQLPFCVAERTDLDRLGAGTAGSSTVAGQLAVLEQSQIVQCGSGSAARRDADVVRIAMAGCERRVTAESEGDHRCVKLCAERSGRRVGGSELGRGIRRIDHAVVERQTNRRGAPRCDEHRHEPRLHPAQDRPDQHEWQRQCH